MKILGIDVHIHWSMLGMLAFFCYSGYSKNGIEGAISTGVSFAVVFSFVLMHEFGHCLAARHIGIGTKSIILMPLGGVASLERMPTDPIEEMFVTIWGPMVNVICGILAFLVLIIFPATTAISLPILYFNIIMVAFNMLPAFPMDGGRIFRAMLAWGTGDYDMATRWAILLGKVCAVGFLIFGFHSGQYTMMLIGVFIFLACLAEAAAEKKKVNTFTACDGDAFEEEEKE